jgi:hypothetical protein
LYVFVGAFPTYNISDLKAVPVVNLIRLAGSGESGDDVV